MRRVATGRDRQTNQTFGPRRGHIADRKEIVINAAFTTKVTAWSTAPAIGDGRPHTTRDTPKGVQN